MPGIMKSKDHKAIKIVFTKYKTSDGTKFLKPSNKFEISNSLPRTTARLMPATPSVIAPPIKKLPITKELAKLKIKASNNAINARLFHYPLILLIAFSL